ncbi:MAG: hypothetical protein EOM90_00905 [Alphaproteobacteria bacterium]|nr:hypothetical protein [Alphaproteobacteria bacterium]
MQPFSIQIKKAQCEAVRFAINYKRMNIAVIRETALPGPIPEGDPDTQMDLALLSEDLAEVFYLADFAAKQKSSITLS